MLSTAFGGGQKPGHDSWRAALADLLQTQMREPVEADLPLCERLEGSVILCDVNVLVYAHREESVEHDANARLRIELATGQEPFGCSELVLSGFVRIVTNPRIFGEPTALDQALAFTDALLAQPTCARLRRGPGHWNIFARLCGDVGARGKLVADAYHAALAIEYGCEWLSADADFARFSGLRWRHPLQLR